MVFYDFPWGLGIDTGLGLAALIRAGSPLEGVDSGPLGAGLKSRERGAGADKTKAHARWESGVGEQDADGVVAWERDGGGEVGGAVTVEVGDGEVFDRAWGC